MNWKVGLIGLVPAAFAAAVIGAKLNAFDIPEGLKINDALAGDVEKTSEKPVPKLVERSASNPVRLEEYKP